MGPHVSTLAAPELATSLADLGQRLLELQRSLVACAPAVAEDPRVIAALHASEARVEQLHVRAWSAAAELGLA